MRRLVAVMSFGMLVVALLGASPSAVAQGGYDEWGYNYTAHRFSGDYCHSLKVETCEWSGVRLDMTWNDAWLSKNGERPASYIGSGAWITNHMWGEYVGDDGKIHTWTYFAKIVAKPTADYSCEANGGTEIWTDFCTVQSVYNDPFGRSHGLEVKAVNPGLGH